MRYRRDSAQTTCETLHPCHRDEPRKQKTKMLQAACSGLNEGSEQNKFLRCGCDILLRFPFFYQQVIKKKKNVNDGSIVRELGDLVIKLKRSVNVIPQVRSHGRCIGKTLCVPGVITFSVQLQPCSTSRRRLTSWHRCHSFVSYCPR